MSVRLHVGCSLFLPLQLRFPSSSGCPDACFALGSVSFLTRRRHASQVLSAGSCWRLGTSMQTLIQAIYLPPSLASWCVHVEALPQQLRVVTPLGRNP